MEAAAAAVDAWGVAALPVVGAGSAGVATASEAEAAGAWAETSEVRAPCVCHAGTLYS